MRDSIHHPTNVVHLASLDDASTDLGDPTGHRCVWVGCDFSAVPRPSLAAFARRLLAAGAVYLCAWGTGCEAMHDAMGEEIVAALVSAGRIEERDDVIMTTWHAHESLAEALWFFRFCAWPASKYEHDFSRLVVLIGSVANVADVSEIVAGREDEAIVSDDARTE